MLFVQIQLSMIICAVVQTLAAHSVWINIGLHIQETTISRVAIDYDGLWLFCSCNPIAKCKFGELVFLTKEEAEKALKGGTE